MNLRGLVLVAAFAAGSALAGADVVQHLTFDGTTLGNGNTDTGNVWVLGMGSSEDAYIGELTFTDVTASSTLYTVCASISETLNSNTQNYNVLNTQDTGDIFTAPGGDAQISAAGLELAGAIVQASTLSWAGSGGTADQWASVQVAVWSALYNGAGGFNANGTDFKVTMNSGSIADANADYNAGVALLAAHPNTSAEWYQYQTPGNNPWTGVGGQDQLTPDSEPHSDISMTPGPAAVLPFALGLLRRRRAKKA